MSISHTNTRKRKRRRGEEKPALSAQLILDNRLNRDVSFISNDLFDELFPAHDGNNEETPCYIALSSQQPHDLNHADKGDWTVIPVTPIRADNAATKDVPPRSVHVSAASVVGQLLVGKLSSSTTTTAGRQTARAPVDVRVLDVVPLPLETVVVDVARVLLGKHAMSHDEDDNEKMQEEVKGQLVKLLANQRLLYTGELMRIPYRTPNSKTEQMATVSIQICEPVDQGYVTPSTKLVLTQATRTHNRQKQLLNHKTRSIPAALLEDEGEDTSNEQFYSAAEGPAASPARTVKKSRMPSFNVQASESSSSEEEETDISDDDGEAIGLSLPGLPGQPSGSLSAFDSNTPRNGLFGNGTATPGSIISTFSTSTVRPGDTKGRLFEVRQLFAPVPDGMLHPKPAADEDDEARVYTDSSTLGKLGCFSGDWVSLEVATDDPLSSLNMWHKEEQMKLMRVAKVYALPSISEQRPRYTIDRSGRRGSSSSYTLGERPPLTVFVSPILFANLQNASRIRLAPLPAPLSSAPTRSTRQAHRMPASSLPPVAKEVSLIKIAAPIATEREVQDALIQQLRKWFQTRKRILKTGDLIPIPLDEDISRALYRGTNPEEDQDQDEVDLESMDKGSDNVNRTQVVWFKVGSVLTDAPVTEDEDTSPDYWAGMTLAKPSVTRMANSGSEQARYPSTMTNYWQYYLGLKPIQQDSSRLLTTDASAATQDYISQTRRRFRELISAGTSSQAVHLKLPPVAILLVSTQRHIGKAMSVHHACADLGIHVFDIDSYDILSEDSSGGSDVKTIATLEARAERAMSCGPEHTALLIRHIDVLTADRTTASLTHILSTVRVLVATTTAIDKVPEGVRSLFTHELEISAPDEHERAGLLSSITALQSTPLAPDLTLTSVALKTAALVAGDLVDVVDRASIARLSRLEALAKSSSNNPLRNPSDPPITVRDILLSGGTTAHSLTTSDFTTAIDAARKNFADSIGAPKIPKVSWSDVGGLSHVKDAVMETIQLPLERPELFAKGMKKRSGILFYGPPGTGKTLLAKAIATEFSLNFFSVKGPELLNMYIGESEANVRRVFQRARDARPCVVFFDELDSVAPKRGNQGDSGGVMDRIVSQLLAELDGMSSGSGGAGGVFVIGATNRPDLLDQALLRPGRFDKMLYLGVSDTHEKQLTILEALTRKFTLAPELRLKRVADALPFTYTGADLYALCSDAMLKAITRRATEVDEKVKAINAERASEANGTSARDGKKMLPITIPYFFDHYATPTDTAVVVSETDFEAARRELVPSVSVKELEHYDRVRRMFEQGGGKEGERKEMNGGGGKMKMKMKMALPQRVHPLIEKAGRVDARSNGVLGMEHDADADGIVQGTQAMSLQDNVGSYTNGTSRDRKGKGKAIATSETAQDDAYMNGFGEAGGVGGDDGLYD